MSERIKKDNLWYEYFAITNIQQISLSSMNGDPSPTDEQTNPLKQNGEEQYEDYGENDVGIEIDVQDLSSALDTTEAVNGQSPSNR